MQAVEEPEHGFAAINVTPLTDVLLVLLIIFLITGSSLTAPSAGLELPRIVSLEQAEQKGLVLEMTVDGRLLHAGQPVADLESLLQAQTGQSLILRADRRLPYGQVGQVVDKARSLGWHQVVLAARWEPER